MDDILDSELAELLRRPGVWDTQVPTPRAPQRIVELASLASRLGTEDREAAALLDSLASKPSAWWRTGVMKSPAGATAGTVRQLLERMRSEIRKSPARALELTSLAVEIANEISLIDYPSDFVISLRADAWRDQAFTLQFLGRFHDAVAALEEAERLQRETALPEYGLARILLVRANILTVTDKKREAIECAGEAAEIFLDFGDRAKYASARITQAAMLHEYGAVREAVQIWEAIKNEDVLDELNRVAVIYNLGLGYREMGNTAKAVEHVTLAIAEYELLGMITEAARARWALATTLVSAGKFSPAVALFDRAWKDFEALEMEADAALVALELAETLLVIGETGRVPQICRTLLDRFTRAGMTSRAITALAYLREVVALGKAQPPVIRQVREFLRDLPSQGRPTLSLSLYEPER
jgi:tetratricopeptide (TPR) repeat protein